MNKLWENLHIIFYKTEDRTSTTQIIQSCMTNLYIKLIYKSPHN